MSPLQVVYNLAEWIKNPMQEKKLVLPPPTFIHCNTVTILFSPLQVVYNLAD
jgi:hypothetical protein